MALDVDVVVDDDGEDFDAGAEVMRLLDQAERLIAETCRHCNKANQERLHDANYLLTRVEELLVNCCAGFPDPEEAAS